MRSPIFPIVHAAFMVLIPATYASGQQLAPDTALPKRSFDAKLDTLFVQETSSLEVYRATPGTIVNLQPNVVVFWQDTIERVYTPKVVNKVKVFVPDPSTLGYDSKRQWANTADVYWNDDESQFVRMVKGLPVLGTVASPVFDWLPRSVGASLALVIILAMSAYLIYKIYEIVIVTRNMQMLNGLKLRLELDHIRYALYSVQKGLNIISDFPWDREREAELLKNRMLIDAEAPPSGLAVLKYKVLRLPSERKVSDIRMQWEKHWRSYETKTARHVRSAYWVRIGAEWALLVTLCIYFAAIPPSAFGFYNAHFAGIGYTVQDIFYVFYLLVVEATLMSLIIRRIIIIRECRNAFRRLKRA